MQMTPLGPRTGAEGKRWCCGLNCISPGKKGKCPYGLKIEPEKREKPAKLKQPPPA